MSRLRKRQLTLKQKQAFLGAQSFYFYFIPACILALLICYIYLFYVRQNSSKNHEQMSSASLFVHTSISIISYIGAYYFYNKCHSIDITPVLAQQSIENDAINSEGSQLVHKQINKFKPLKNFCKICKYQSDYRTKHCYKCQVCVQRYDHHCFWIGNCVGRHNHRQFYFFLFLQTINNVATFLCIIYTYSSLKQFIEQLSIVIKLGFLSLVVLQIGFICFTGYLFVYHTVLIMTGMTTWEHMRRHKITYLKYLPIGFNPFSLGIVENIKLFFSENTRGNGQENIQSWQNMIPTFEQAKRVETGCNLFENQYYSCC